MTLYKSKVIDSLIKELNARLADDTLTDAEQEEVLRRLDGYNRVKVQIAHKLRRLIL